MAPISYVNATCAHPGAGGPSVDDLNLEGQDGECMVLAGPSGSGRSPRCDSDSGPTIGRPARVTIDASTLHAFDPSTSARLD